MSTRDGKKTKPLPKRYQPKGLTILHEDRDIIVVDKSAGLLTISTETVRDHTAYFLLNEYVRKGNPKSRNRVFIVHRLDRDTSGVLVFARSEEAKRFLQDSWQDFQKLYQAVVQGRLTEKKGEITSYLAENQAHQMYSVKDPAKGQLARTGYRVLKEGEEKSLLEIELHTGRKNQIRVHLAEAGHPVVGDEKYGGRENRNVRLALHSAVLTILHPFSRDEMTFHAPVPAFFRKLLKQK